MGISPAGTNDAQPPGKQERTCPRLDPTGTGIGKPAIHKAKRVSGDDNEPSCLQPPDVLIWVFKLDNRGSDATVVSLQ